MSATGAALALADGQRIAETLLSWLAGVYERAEIAGSARRKRPTVNDVELVLVPTIGVQHDLFGEPAGTCDLLDARLNTWLADGIVSKRRLGGDATRWGRHVKYVVFQGVAFDVFSVDAARFGWILALRTGPAAFSRQLVVPTDRRTKDDRPGLLPPTLMPRDGWLTWRTSGQRLSTPEEHDVFEAFGLPYVEPMERR